MTQDEFEAKCRKNLEGLDSRARAIIGGAGTAFIVSNADADQAVDEKPLPLPTMNGHEKVVENAIDDDVLPLPVMDFGSVRRPALKKDSELTLNDEDAALPLPNWDWCRENE